MSTVIDTSKISPANRFSSDDNLQIYCGLDTAVTLEVSEVLSAQFSQPPQVYDFECALQAPYLDVMFRGFAVDKLSRSVAIDRIRERELLLQRKLDKLSRAVWDKPLNPRSFPQMVEFLYKALRLPEVWLSKKGVKKLSANREALEKCDIYLHARPFVGLILALRDLGKQRSVLETEIDPDGRMRCSYNIAGTETGRPSSSSNAFGTGTNLQNVAPGLRYVFVADAGHKLGVIDLEQVEARDVGFIEGVLFGDWTFLDACESGDLHTNNCKLVWPELKWTGEPKLDREIADGIFYRDFTYRDMSKRGGHLSNYMGTAWTASRALKVPQAIMEEFQQRYCRGPSCAYPAHSRWWQWTAQQLQTTSLLSTLFGRERHFFGRPDDDATLREGIAFQPQGTTADRMNLGMWRVWKHAPEVKLLGQTFDSITFQYSEDLDEQLLIPKLLELIKVEIVAPNGRSYIVPGEAKVGWNWGYRSERRSADGTPRVVNPMGLQKWSAKKPDERTRSYGLNRTIA